MCPSAFRVSSPPSPGDEEAGIKPVFYLGDIHILK